MTEGALQERPQGKEISCKVMGLVWAKAFPWWGSLLGPSIQLQIAKRDETAPLETPTQINETKPKSGHRGTSRAT